MAVSSVARTYGYSSAIQAADLVCEILETVFRSQDRFEREAARRGITIPQLLAAAIARGLYEHDLLRPDVPSN